MASVHFNNALTSPSPSKSSRVPLSSTPVDASTFTQPWIDMHKTRIHASLDCHDAKMSVLWGHQEKLSRPMSSSSFAQGCTTEDSFSSLHTSSKTAPSPTAGATCKGGCTSAEPQYEQAAVGRAAAGKEATAASFLIPSALHCAGRSSYCCQETLACEDLAQDVPSRCTSLQHKMENCCGRFESFQEEAVLHGLYRSRPCVRRSGWNLIWQC